MSSQSPPLESTVWQPWNGNRPLLLRRCDCPGNVCHCDVSTPSSISGTSASSDTLVVTGSRPISINDQWITQIEPLSWIPASQRYLLFHFVQSASRLTTCNTHGQEIISQMVIPRALRSPALLKAILAVSALHKKTVITCNIERARLEKSIRGLTASSLQAFQVELRDSDQTNKTALSAAALFLCEQKLHSGDINPQSWRVHLEGAKALMASANQLSKPQDVDLLQFLNRWYQAVESLAALTPRGLPNAQLEHTLPRSLIATSLLDHDYLDEYCGYCTGLNEILREIGAAAWERRHATLDPHVPLSERDWDAEADWLETSVLRRMEQSSSSPPMFYPGVLDHLTPTEFGDFILCNEVYHHMALIHIRHRVRRLPSSSMAVQDPMQRLLKCASLISPSSGLSPWLALTAPVFVAGCVAHGNDRELVRILLRRLYDTVQSQSMQRALELLEIFWAENDEFRYQDWDEFEASKNFDFIPF